MIPGIGALELATLDEDSLEGGGDHFFLLNNIAQADVVEAGSTLWVSIERTLLPDNSVLLILYYRNLQSLQPHLLRPLILGNLDMHHLLPELPYQGIHLNMCQASINQIPINLLYLI